jgi:hypothetical protein
MKSSTMPIAALAALALWLGVVAHPETQGVAAVDVWPTPSEADLGLVRGALDMDVHADPDIAEPQSAQAPRGFDVLEIARRAKELGMRGFVIKQHYDQSAALAYVARKEVPGLEVYGGVVQNLIIGGLNPASVYHLAEVKGGWGRIVWFPTFDSESNARQRSRDGVPKRFVQVLSGGELVQAGREVIAALKATRTRDTDPELVLQTGYVTPEEALAIIREGNKQGVKHMVVSHAATGTSAMSIPQMQEAIKLGAFLEFASVSTMGASPEIQPAAYAGMMRKVGVENVIMGSDFGQPGRPMPPDGLALYAGLMRRQGLTERDLYRMMAENPARAMGLSPTAPIGAK